MPRSGSMWTYNVARSLINLSGQSFIPKDCMVDESSILLELSDSQPTDIDFACIKTHHCITPLDNSKVKFICNYRDVRDSMLSYMRFMKCGFDKAIDVVVGMMNLTDHYFKLKSSDVCLPIKYEELENNYHENIKLINEFLDLEVSDVDVNNLLEELSKKILGRD